jgi:uncharacterized protein YqjF (DUF2071 family)
MEIIPSLGSENFLKGSWKNLVFLNYAVDPEILKSHLPEGCEIDLFDGKAYVSLVALQFLNLNVMGLSVPGFHAFPQINLRFYIKYGEQRGIRFLREYLPSRLAAFGARMIYHEPCESATMTDTMSITLDQVRAQYDLESSVGDLQIKVLAQNHPQEVIAESFADFCHFREVGVSKNLRGRTFSYQIYSPPWKTFPVQDVQTTEKISHFFGEEFSVLDRAPDSVLFFEGSDVALSGAQYPEESDLLMTQTPPSLTTISY